MSIYYVGIIPYSDSLTHHGIKGQKWGIRRYQNLDGTLTPAGKERYGSDISQLKDGKLRRQMLRNGYTLSIKNGGKGLNREKKLTRRAVEDMRSASDAKKRKDIGEKFIKDLASVRLESMGYEANSNNVEVLSAKKWFRNSTWLTNTLASIGAEGVEYTSNDDYKVGRKF